MNLKLCIHLTQYCACIVYFLCFSYILIVIYSSTHAVCCGDCNSEDEDPGKVFQIE